MSHHPSEDRNAFGRVANLVTLVGWVALAFEAVFPVAGKGGPAWYLYGWWVSSALCLAVAISYTFVGRLYLRTTSRSALRPTIRPFLLGAALASGFLLILVGMQLVSWASIG